MKLRWKQKMGTTKVTNSLLVVIALTLLWIACKFNGSVRPEIPAVVRTVSAQTAPDNNTAMDEEGPLEAMCTLRAVEEAAARALTGDLRIEVVTALNQTNQTLWNIQGQIADIPQRLNQMESMLQKIVRNTSPYQ
jgi:hypothetical protein